MFKRVRFSLFALCSLLMLFSCEKVNITEEEQSGKSKGNLTVSVFQLEQTPFDAISRAEPAAACNRLNFAIYALDGTRVKQINQVMGDTDFGTAAFQLNEGTYRLVVVAHSSSSNPTMTDPAKIQFSNSTGYSDTFLCSGTVEIKDKPVDMKLTLDRIVALCRFVITDDYPSEVARMRFQYTGGSGAFSAISGFGCVNSTQTVTFEIVTGQKQFDLYTFLHDTSGTIHLETAALDANGNVISEHTFDVPLKRNNITWLQGSYFAPTTFSSSINSIDIKNEWAGESHIGY